MNGVDAEVTTSQRSQALLAFSVVGVIGILLLPLPAVALDALLALSIGLSVLVLLVALGVKRPLDFSVFPTLLLITTLFRLGLNVATTRIILTRGSEGATAAGHVIETFGRYAVGGSLIVGLVVFLILLIVNFIVITKGAGRVAEVAARFTLDALPGKQMAIDADLAAGTINDAEAKNRRAGVEREIEFFGSMDGASKFVRGDAIAGLLITIINIIGGLLAGVLRDNTSFGTAAETYTLLTVGDGLVSQIPALLISVAAGIVVTRAGSGTNLGADVGGQMFGQSRTLGYAAAVLAALAIIPGMPALPFLALAGGALALSRRKRPAPPAAGAGAAAAGGRGPAGAEAKAERPQDLVAIDALELEVGHALLPLIDQDKGGELPGRVTNLRKQIATDLGVVLPPVHLKDNLRLEAHEYRVRMRGIEIARGVAHADRVMALDPAGNPPRLDGVDGVAAKEPAFGLPALWIPPAERSRAEVAGLTVVDAASVLTTHLSETMRRNVHELVGRQEVQELLAVCAKDAPKLVEDVVPATVTLGELVRVVRGLLREGLSIRDLRSILEAVADAAPRSKDPVFLVEQVRRRLYRHITTRVADPTGTVRAITLDRGAEDLLRKSLGQSDGEAVLAPDLDTARRLISVVEEHAARRAAEGLPTVIITAPDLRRPLFEFLSRFVNDFYVITARELVPGTAVEPAGTVEYTAIATGRAA
jgi:flagellar biosynthesis protein FlhA